MIRFLQTPGPVKKIVLSSILLIFCGAMVITLIPGGLGSNLGFGPPQAGVVANIGSQSVTRDEVVHQAQLMLRQQFPRGNAMSAQLLPFFTSRAAEQLITEKTIISEAQRMGFRATDEDVIDELQHGVYSATFFPNGKFIGQDAYENLLQQNELTPQQFEQDVKNQILFRKVRNLVTSSASVSDGDVRQEFDKRNTQVKFQYAYFSEADLRKQIHPTDGELKAYYDQHKAQYNNSIPEKRKIAYALIDNNKLAADAQVSDQDLRSYYDQHRDDFRVPESVTVSHILIKTPTPGPDGKVDQKAVDAAKAKAQDILKQVKAGGNFAELAKKYSEDPGSAKNGGSLGPIQRGRTVPEFEKTAFSLPKGQISDLVQTTYGFHIIKVDDKQQAHTKSLDEVKSQIEPLIRRQKADRIAESQANALLSGARSEGLAKAADAKHLSVVTTDFFARTDTLPGIGNAPQLMDAVFGEGEKSPPDLVQTSQGYVVLQLLGIKPPATPSFEEIRQKVVDEFTNERATTLLTQKTQELSDRAKAEHNLQKAAKELGATFKTSDFVKPDGQVPDIGSMTGPAAVAFTMKPGDISGPINSGSTGAVLQIQEKQAPPQGEFAQQKDQIRDALLQQKQDELFGVFVSNLRTQMEKSGKIKVNQEELKGLTRTSSEGM
ncbi:MAG TPA: peptidyl-prolyl cis-trans isomerase [Terriglobales bacterium]|nr:peptidyl-prolyl cis-trans isomerase [Terriglobales bacterium]